MPGPWCKPIGSNTKDSNPFILCFQLCTSTRLTLAHIMSYPSIAKSFQPFPSAMVQDQLATQGRLWPRRTRSSVPERWNHQNWRDGACFGHLMFLVSQLQARHSWRWVLVWRFHKVKRLDFYLYCRLRSSPSATSLLKSTNRIIPCYTYKKLWANNAGAINSFFRSWPQPHLGTMESET